MMAFLFPALDVEVGVTAAPLRFYLLAAMAASSYRFLIMIF